MKIQSFLGIICLPIFFVACGPMSNGASAPEIVSGAKGVVSPFDTIEVKFTEGIDSILSSQVESDLPVLFLRGNSDGTTWKVAADTTGGHKSFYADTTYTVNLKGIEGSNGKTPELTQVLSFTTMPVLDSDGMKTANGAVIDNDQYGRAEVLSDSTGFFNGVSFDKGMSVAGIISGRSNGIDDMYDWYRISAKFGDSIEIKLTDLKANLDLEFTGPEDANGENLYESSLVSENSGRKDEQINFKIDASRAAFGLEIAQAWGAPRNYWICVKKNDAKSSYVLEVKRLSSGK